MASGANTDGEKIVSEALSLLRDMAREKFSKESEHHKLDELRAAVRKVAKKQSKHVSGGSSISEIKATLLNHLLKHRVDAIKRDTKSDDDEREEETQEDSRKKESKNEKILRILQLVLEVILIDDKREGETPKDSPKKESKSENILNISKFVLEAIVLLGLIAEVGINIAELVHDLESKEKIEYKENVDIAVLMGSIIAAIIEGFEIVEHIAENETSDKKK